MSALPSAFVIDACVLIKLVLHEEDSALAREVVGGLLADPPAAIEIPDLAFAEFANVLSSKVRGGEITAADADKDFADLAALELPSTPSAQLGARALALACAYRITAYDACYVALAEWLGATLLTADGKLAAALRGTEHAVLTLAACRPLEARGDERAKG